MYFALFNSYRAGFKKCERIFPSFDNNTFRKLLVRSGNMEKMCFSRTKGEFVNFGSVRCT